MDDTNTSQTSDVIQDYSISPALFLTTSFEKRWIKGDPILERTKYSYSRTQNPNFTTLENIIKKFYNTNSCYLYPSGMSAISTLFDLYSGDDVVFIVGDEMYSDTFRTLNYLGEKLDNFKVIPVNVSDTDGINKLVETHKDKLKLLFFESCTNPSGHMLDYNNLKKLKNIYPNVIIAIDNSWLSPSLFNPYDWGADLVVESISKYLGGGRVIMGHITGNDDIMRDIIWHSCVFGLRASQMDCWIVADNCEMLYLRMKHISETTKKLAVFLEEHPKVNRVMYPLLESHPTYKNAKKVLEDKGPGIIWFHVSFDKKNTKNMMNRSKIIKYATSYGKSHTLMDPYPWEENSGYYDDEKGEFGTWIRLSIGFACTLDNLIKELSEMLLK